ncbi:MAG: type III secretion system chaperone [Chlamydia sp.]
MFQDFMKTFLKEIFEQQQEADSPQIPLEIPEIESTYTLEVEGIEITISDSSPSLLLSSTIPLQSYTGNTEELFTDLLRGNFMGQATRNATLGLDEDGSNIVVSHLTFGIKSYRAFRNSIEDFINTACFWKSRIEA